MTAIQDSRWLQDLLQGIDQQISHGQVQILPYQAACCPYRARGPLHPNQPRPSVERPVKADTPCPRQSTRGIPGCCETGPRRAQREKIAYP